MAMDWLIFCRCNTIWRGYYSILVLEIAKHRYGVSIWPFASVGVHRLNDWIILGSSRPGDKLPAGCW
jgi:hypothetical protein